jgi:ATP-dependent helicase HrpA
MLQQSDKDQQKMQEMARFQQWYWQSIENRQKDESVNPERDQFRSKQITLVNMLKITDNH